MKAILVIDEMPTECIECQFCRVLADDKITETRCILTAKRNEDGVNTRAEWCPLKTLPQKKDIDKALAFGGYENIIQESLVRGYNACLDEITGETE